MWKLTFCKRTLETLIVRYTCALEAPRALRLFGEPFANEITSGITKNSSGIGNLNSPKCRRVFTAVATPPFMHHMCSGRAVRFAAYPGTWSRP